MEFQIHFYSPAPIILLRYEQDLLHRIQSDGNEPDVACGVVRLFVNRAFAAALGMDAAAVVATGWRALIHPEDLAEAARAEASAWSRDVAVVTRYRRGDGGWVTFRWYAPRYGGGVTLALARLV